MPCCQSDKPARKLRVVYDRDIHTQASHSACKQKISLAGCCGGDELSPLDLLAIGLASCLMTVMGQAAVARGLDIVGAKGEVDYDMADYRLTQISVRIQLPHALAPTARTKLEKASKTCPVYRALDPKLKVCVQYLWPE